MRCWRRRVAVPALLAIALVAPAFSGCAVTQNITLDASGGGTGELSVDLQPIFVAYYRDLLTSFGGAQAADRPIFDLEAIAGGFEGREHVTLTATDVPEEGSLRVSFSFDDIREVLAQTPAFGGPGNGDADTEGPVAFESSGDTRTLTVTMDRDIIAYALSLAPVADMGSVGLLLPPEGGGLGPDEYAEYVAWALEDYEDAGEGSDPYDVVRNARIIVNVSVPGTVVAIEGGRKQAGGARFEIDVVELLTLEEPVTYAVSFRVR